MARNRDQLIGSKPNSSRADVFADRVARVRKKSSSSQSSFSPARQGQQIVRPKGQSFGPVGQSAPVGQAAPAAPQSPYSYEPQSYTGTPQPNWPDNLIEAAYGAPAGSAELARQKGWGAGLTGGPAPAYSQDESFTPYAPTAPPGQTPPPAGSIPQSWLAGSGSFNVNAGAQDGRPQWMIDQAVASMQTPERIAQDGRTRANSPYSPDGRPWSAVDTDLAAKAANPPGPDWGYFNGTNWVPLTTYGSGHGAATNAPAGGYNTPQSQHNAVLQAYGYTLSPEERTKQQMIQMWGPTGTGW